MKDWLEDPAHCGAYPNPGSDDKEEAALAEFCRVQKGFFAVAHPLMTRLRADRLKMLPGWVFDVAPPEAALLSLLEESTSIDDVWLDMCMELDTDVFDPAEAAILCDRVPESLWFSYHD